MPDIFRQLNADNGVLYTWYEAMHTRIDLILCDRSENHCQETAHQIKQEIARLEKIADRFNPDSELYLLNRTACLHPVVVSEELFHILSDCFDLYERTCQCFDITVQSTIQQEDRVGCVIMDQDQQTVYFSKQGITLDLCGYIKGYTLDKIRTILKEQSIQDALISLGTSSVLAIGNHPAGKGWMVNEVLLTDEVLTTSGNNRTDRQHIRNPRNGEFITGQKEISVITPTGAEGEALSTALFAATPAEQSCILANFSKKYVTTCNLCTNNHDKHTLPL